MAAEARGPRWLVVRVRSPSEASIDALAEGLVAYGASAVQEAADSLVTWFPAPTDPDRFVATLASTLEQRVAGLPVHIECEWHEDQDWSLSWRAGLAPRRIGGIVVSPTWCAPELRPGEILVTIDPQMAFGTGEHASTRGVLRLLQRIVRHGDVVLDVGTGSGVLAIAAARLGAHRVIAVDNDADALINARENVERNEGSDRVALEHGTVDGPWLQRRGLAFDLILANVLSGVLIPLLPAFRAALRDGGRVILAGILRGEAAAVRVAVGAAGLRIEAEDAEDEWWGVALAR